MSQKMKKLGERLSQLRQDQGYTQENIAVYLNVDQSYISKIEKGERSIDSVSLEALADLYLISVDDLISEKETSSFRVAFRKDKYGQNELKNLARINRIVLNQKFMNDLEEDDAD